MTTYTARIGADNIADLTDTAGAIGRAGLLDHVAAEGEQPDVDTMVFDNYAASILRDLPQDCDGHMANGGPGVGEQIWVGGIEYPVQVQD